MHKYLGVLSSDTVNRDRYRISFGALEDMISNNAVKGMPLQIDHDFHRPHGWVFPFGILVEPKISKIIGSFIVCDDESDTSLIYPKIQNYWQYTNNEACKNHIEEFKELLQNKFSDKGSFISKGCVVYNFLNIVDDIFPKLFTNIDKSGLVYLDEILEEFDYVGCGVFKNKYNEFCIFCHQYFNRNLSLFNRYNTSFIDEFIRLSATNKEIKFRIAIDHNLIGLSETYTGTLELDYWWGPKFNDDISKIPNQVTRYECNEEQKFFSSVLGTEFWWKTDGNEKTLEIEEIREKPSLGIDENSYGCRYIHSIYDNNKKEFIHFDGAIRVYSEDQIIDRWETDIKKIGKNTNYTKLFRIDGKLELADWKKLCILYYKGNPLLFEYFGAKEKYESLKNTSKPRNNLADYIPYKVAPKDGVRLFVSYHNKSQNYNSFDRIIINPDTIEHQGGMILKVFEYDIIEIEKYLNRIGEKINYPKDIRFIKPFDSYTNYPIILHGVENTGNLIQKTLEAFKTVFTIQNQTLNKTISFTIGWEMEEFEVRLSVFGKSSEIVKWLNINSNIPIEYKNFREWFIQQKKWVYNNYNYIENDFTHLLKDDGIFYIKRVFINNETISFHDKEDGNYFKINTTNNPLLRKLMEEKKIFPSYFGLIEKAFCTKTGKDYLSSKTFKYLDEDVKMAIKKIELLGFFWTDELDEKNVRPEN